MTGTGEVLG